MKILIVEDEAKTAKFLKKGFEEAGFVIDVACDGLEGFHLAREVDFDLIVLDVMLPILDGWQVLSRLRQADRPSLVLLLTARDAVHERVRGLELGADDYLVKPRVFRNCWRECDHCCVGGRLVTRKPFEWPTWKLICCANVRHALVNDWI